MTSRIRHLALGAALALALILPSVVARADPNQLFAGSTLVTEPRFSDEIVGSGPDVVLIPGLASSRATYKATAESLKPHFRLHLIQIAGFAGEPARDNANGPVLLPTAEAIDAYLKAQHLTPATIIGHSLGGTTILYLAENHPEDLKTALVVDSLPFFGVLFQGPQATAESIKPLADNIRNAAGPQPKAQRDAQMASMATSPSDREIIGKWGELSDHSAVANAFADDISLDLRPGLGKITAPITLLVPDYAALGSPPGTMKANYAAAYADAKSVKVVEITHSLHFIMLDQPEQFAAAVGNFLSRP